MKILLIHNRYMQQGGEDVVFDNEKSLLCESGIDVKALVFKNRLVQGAFERIRAAFRSIFSIASFLKVFSTIRSFKPDIIHVHNIFYTASPSILWAAYLLKTPVVLTLHNFRLLCPGAYFLKDNNVCELCRYKAFPWDGIKFSCFRKSRSATLTIAATLYLHKLLGTWHKTVNRYICLNLFAANIFADSWLHIPESKILVKPNWSYYKSLNRQNINRKGFLYVGRLSIEKGVFFLLKAFKQIETDLSIVGDGPLREALQKEASSNVSFFGNLQRDSVLQKMAGAKAVIVPSCWYEMFPMVIIEAFSMGTPVIASSIGSIPTIIKHGENGLLFEKMNKMDLIEKILLLSNFNVYDLMCRNAKLEFTKKYSHQKAFDSLLNIYLSTKKR